MLVFVILCHIGQVYLQALRELDTTSVYVQPLALVNA